MSEKMLNTRIQQKHDIEVNWSKAVNFIPKIGEVIVYDPDETHVAARVKIGDGERTVGQLPFISGQADWNVNDESSAAYVKNRTHWVETNRVVIANQQTVECTIDRYLPAEGNIVHTSPLVDGHTYLFILNGTEYTGIALYDSSIDAIDVHVDSVDENDLLYGMIYYPDVDQLTIFTNVEDSFSIVIYEIHDIVHQLDPKFIPTASEEQLVQLLIDIDALPVMTDSNGAIFTHKDSILLI